jgi:hypothetical protein
MIQFQTQHQAMRRGLSVRRAFAAGVILILAATAAMAQTCTADRTPLEMAGHTLCLLNTAMPSIHRREDGSVRSLVWSRPERLPAEVKLPTGTFYLIVELDSHIPPQLLSPTLDESEPSNLPMMRETIDNLVTLPIRKRLHPVEARLNGKPFVLECGKAIEPRRKSLGGDDCKLISESALGIWLEVHLGTVDWAHEPAWPRLDATWVKTWPSYLDALGTGINNLLSIQ